MNRKADVVKLAMLAVQRHSWEQGVCAQALWEFGEVSTAVAMAHDAMQRQGADGRLALIFDAPTVTYPAASGEVLWRAYELTGNEKYKLAAEKMLEYLLWHAPRTNNEVIGHNEINYYEGYPEIQIWADDGYMVPPFLAVMGQLEEAYYQINGYMNYLRDDKTGLVFQIYEPQSNRFVRKKLWATGNGWTLLGIARVIEEAQKQNREDIADKLIATGSALLDAMLKYQQPDGRFFDIMDDKESFLEGTAAMMMAAAIYRGVTAGWISDGYIKYAELVKETMDSYVDEFGIIHEVCGSPDFIKPGTSAESMASYLMMHAWSEKWKHRK